jgi:hypothetical protein
VKKVIPENEIQESCGAPANIRWEELSVLFSSLSNAGLVELENTPNSKENVIYKTTSLAKSFVYFCLDPNVDYEAEMNKNVT